MSHSPISRSPDLRRLLDEGYAVSLISGLLVVAEVPFVTAGRAIARGRIVVPLNMAGDATIPPSHHVVWWCGGTPCDGDGRTLDNLIQAPDRRVLLDELVADHSFCNKPFGREFCDYHELVTAYVNLLASHAAHIDPDVTARTRRGPVVADNPEIPFHYIDTATARAGVGLLAGRLAGGSVAIVGLGGTGSYVLDLIAKTPVAHIHLFDGDTFDQHNAFRAPGAASLEEVGARRMKVDYFASIYSRMHRGIVPHRAALTLTNLDLLDHVEFVFLCLDDSSAKRPIIERLERRDLPFIDVGMGLQATEAGILGSLRVTTSTPEMRAHVRDNERIPFLGGGREEVYSGNVQVADLNALNAALAVLRWKKLRGFYADRAREHFAVFGVEGNQLLNDDRIETC